MPESEEKSWFAETQDRAKRLKALAQGLRDGTDVPLSEHLQELQSLTSAIRQDSRKPTTEDKATMLEQLQQQYGPLPWQELFAKAIGERIRDLQAFTQEYRKPSFQDLSRAVLFGDHEKVRRLLAAGVTVHGIDAAGHSLLLSATIQGHMEA